MAEMGTNKLIDIVPGALAPPGTKQSRLLGLLLRGERVDPTKAVEYNLTTVHARAAELRRTGWPVMTDKLQHPNYPRETYPVYYFDAHFLRWCQGQDVVEPRDYKKQAGRGKFKV